MTEHATRLKVGTEATPLDAEALAVARKVDQSSPLRHNTEDVIRAYLDALADKGTEGGAGE